MTDEAPFVTHVLSELLLVVGRQVAGTTDDARLHCIATMQLHGPWLAGLVLA